MYNYKCDMCGCYLDPNEGSRCEECKMQVEQRYRKMKRASEAVRISDDGQYEILMEVAG